MRWPRRNRWSYDPFGQTLSERQVRAASVWAFWLRDMSPWVFEAEDYEGGPGLNLAMKRVGEYPTGAQLRKRIAAWCELLPTLTDVRRVWLECHAPKRLFEAVCQMRGLESLHIKWGNADALAPMTQLTSLRHVHLRSLTKVTDVAPLALMPHLVTLEVENFKRVQEFDALAAQKNVELLALDGSMWTEQKIASLEPIGQMSGLRSFSMCNARL